jgi:subfamily B ATP-binding cassette protein MsbA
MRSILLSQYDLKNIENLGNRHLLKRCVAYFWPYRWRILVAFLSAIVVSGTTGATAYLVKPAMDDIFVKGDKDALILIPLAYFCVITLKNIARFTQTYIMNVTGFKVLHQLRSELFSKLMTLSIRFFEESRVGMLMSRVLGDVNGIRQSVPAMIMVIREFFTCIGLIGVVIYQDWKMAIIALLVLPMLCYPVILFGKRLRKIGRKLQVQAADINSVAEECLSNIRLIKAFHAERDEIKSFSKESSGILRLSKKQVLASELSSRIMEMVGGVAVSFVLWYGGSRVLSGESTPGTFFSFVAALIMLYEPIKKINDANKTIQRSLASGERVFGLLDSETILPEEGGDTPFETPLKSLEIENISFSYPTGSEPAIKELTLHVRGGERVAIVGPSGSGKTTLVNLLPRFYDADEGTIHINGVNVEDFDLGSLRRNIGMVSQDAMLFNTTIRANIAYGQDDITDEQVQAAAKAAYAHEFIEGLPAGYDTVCGVRGVKLSGGQKQRLTIARALLKNPALLILDEATSALDTQAERIVQKALDNLMESRTSIVIAHRLSTVLNADKIVVMSKGEVVATGRHEELIESCSLYQTLHRLQFQTEFTEEEARDMEHEG